MRTWAEINLDNLAYNIERIKKRSKGCDIMAIIKADAYGMGAVTIAKELSELGITIFGVSSLEEGIELRENGIDSDILVLGGVFNDELKIAQKMRLQVAVTSLIQIKHIFENGLDIQIHIKVDTGMGRVGFNVNEAKEVLQYCENNRVNIVGIYSHLSVADVLDNESKYYTEEQLKKFKCFEKFKKIKYIHILNSGGILNFSKSIKTNLVRAGIIMYGVYGAGIVPDMKRVFTLKSRILFVKKLLEDTDISYGRIGRGKKGDTIATVAIGYADGLRRELSNKGTVEIDGIKCRIIGRICMDMLMIKIPEILENSIKVGMNVTIMGEDIFDKAQMIDASIYEMFTGLSRRVNRVYLKGGRPYLINSLIGKY